MHAVFGLSTSQCQEIHASERTFSPIFHLAHSVCYKYLDQSGFKRAIKDTQYIVRRSRRHLTEKLQVEVHLHSYKQHLLPWQIYKITNEINCVLIDMKSKKIILPSVKVYAAKVSKIHKIHVNLVSTWYFCTHTHTHTRKCNLLFFNTNSNSERKTKWISLYFTAWCPLTFSPATPFFFLVSFCLTW